MTFKAGESNPEVRSTPLRNVAVSAPAEEIASPLDADDYMWASASYVFWPVLSAPLLLTHKRSVPFVRFHCIQSLIFGFSTLVAFVLFTVVLVTFFRHAASPQATWHGLFFVGLFALWLFSLFGLFVSTLFCAYRAGRGDVFKIPIVGGFAERLTLEG